MRLKSYRSRTKRLRCPGGHGLRGLDMKTVKKVDFPAQLQMSSAKELGIAVRSARTGAGFTLADAAQALGISKQTLSDLELGTGTVTLTLAFQALNALGVSVFVVPAQDNSRVRRALKGAGLGT